MSDNIGGISACWLVFSEDVENTAIFLFPNRILVELKAGKDWQEIPCTPSKTNVQITPTNDRRGTYNVAVSVSIPDFNIKNRVYYMLPESFNNRQVLLKYRTANGKIFVVGSKKNFLHTTVQRLSPGQASGYAGLQINFAGTLPHLELPLL